MNSKLQKEQLGIDKELSEKELDALHTWKEKLILPLQLRHYDCQAHIWWTPTVSEERSDKYSSSRNQLDTRSPLVTGHNLQQKRTAPLIRLTNNVSLFSGLFYCSVHIWLAPVSQIWRATTSYNGYWILWMVLTCLHHSAFGWAKRKSMWILSLKFNNMVLKQFHN